MSDESEWENESEEISKMDRDDQTAPRRKNRGKKTEDAESDVEAETQADDVSSPSSNRRKKLRRVNFDAEGNELDYLPSYQRVTQAGGYLHTKNTRLKISQANKGKMPWNKGQNRSESAKAKISAGVRARNQALLQAKLTNWDMSLEEWQAKKRQIKLLRERVRKAKVALTAKQTMPKPNATLSHAKPSPADKTPVDAANAPPLKRQLKSPPPSSTSSATAAAAAAAAVPSDVAGHKSALRHDNNAKLPPAPSAAETFVSTRAPEPLRPTAAADTPPQWPRMISVFGRDISWTPHILHGSQGVAHTNHPSTAAAPPPPPPYTYMCPQGGPGGLICCSLCSTLYTQYLTRTVTELQEQKLQSVGREVRDLIHWTQGTRETLAQTIKAARRKPIPMRTATAAAATATAAAATTLKPTKPKQHPKQPSGSAKSAPNIASHATTNEAPTNVGNSTTDARNDNPPRVAEEVAQTVTTNGLDDHVTMNESGLGDFSVDKSPMLTWAV
jgi:NUMOD3 motif